MQSHIEFRDEIHFTGRTLAGVLYLIAPEPVTVALEVVIIGKEETQFYHFDSHEDIANSNEFLNRKLPLTDRPIRLDGNYAFPFQFLLPESLPSSFSFNKGSEKTFGELFYFAKVLINGQDSGKVFEFEVRRQDLSALS